MGYAKGKVGSIVLARSKGQQITRAYNDSPKNPRSQKQMMQRSIFASGVKFFAQGRQAFFKFAFENKALKESDYNAFMRENAKRGQYISKSAYQEQTYPVLSPFIMTKGSLPEVLCNFIPAAHDFEVPLTGLAAGANWGAISQKLIDIYGLLGGDIITTCHITATGSTADNTPDVEPEKRERVKWDIKQAVIDTDSTMAVAEALGANAAAEDDCLSFIEPDPETSAVGFCITVSRNSTEGTKVAPAMLQLNTMAQTIVTNAQKESYIQEVLASWNATGEAILQGSIAS